MKQSTTRQKSDQVDDYCIVFWFQQLSITFRRTIFAYAFQIVCMCATVYELYTRKVYCKSILNEKKKVNCFGCKSETKISKNQQFELDQPSFRTVPGEQNVSNLTARPTNTLILCVRACVWQSVSFHNKLNFYISAKDKQ